MRPASNKISHLGMRAVIAVVSWGEWTPTFFVGPLFRQRKRRISAAMRASCAGSKANPR